MGVHLGKKVKDFKIFFMICFRISADYFFIEAKKELFYWLNGLLFKVVNIIFEIHFLLLNVANYKTASYLF